MSVAKPLAEDLGGRGRRRGQRGEGKGSDWREGGVAAKPDELHVGGI